MTVDPQPPPEGDETHGTPQRLAALQRGGGLITALITTVAAFLIGGVVVVATTGKNPISTYQAIFDGTGLNWLFPWISDAERTTAAFNLQTTLVLTTALVLTGLAVAFAFRCGLFNIGGQGQYMVGAIAGGLGRLVVVGAAGRRAHPARARRRVARGSAACGHRRPPQGDGRGARGDRHDHAQLDRLLARHLPPRARWAAPELDPGPGVGAAVERRRRVGAAARLLGQPRAPGPAHRSLHRSRRPRRLLDHAQPDDRSATRFGPSASTRRPRATGASTSPATTSSRWRSRASSPASQASSTSSAGSSGSRSTTSSLLDRLHRHRGCAARAQHGGRRRSLGAALRRTAERHLDAQPRSGDLPARSRGQPHAC